MVGPDVAPDASLRGELHRAQRTVERLDARMVGNMFGQRILGFRHVFAQHAFETVQFHVYGIDVVYQRGSLRTAERTFGAGVRLLARMGHHVTA